MILEIPCEKWTELTAIFYWFPRKYKNSDVCGIFFIHNVILRNWTTSIALTLPNLHAKISELTMCVIRNHFVYAPSQWETTLQCNVISHWLGAYTKWFLCDASVNRYIIPGDIVSSNYSDVIMSSIASQISSVCSVYSTICSGADQRKYQSSAQLAFMRGNTHTEASDAENISNWWRHHEKTFR